MEIQLCETTAPGYRELACLSKTCQVSMESVVPDTKDDIGRILTVKPEIYLKSKDLNGRMASVSAEAAVTVLYINEAETAVSHVRLTQSFTLDYDLSFTDGNLSLQIRLLPSAAQARAINPRKLSVDLEVCGELSVSRTEDYLISQSLPEDLWLPVHLKTEEAESEILTAICEKSMSINEQLAFPEDMPNPKELAAKEMLFQIQDCETVGSRLLVKGQLQLSLIYYAEESGLPCRGLLSVPFSQLVDLGAEDCGQSQVFITPTSDYVELIDSIDGKKLLDLEVHALIQVRSGSVRSVSYISDLYSNTMPCSNQYADFTLTESRSEQSFRLRAEEDVEVPEEFSEVLLLSASLNQCSCEQGNATLDLLCRSTDGKLFSMRRNIVLCPAENTAALENVSVRPGDIFYRIDGKRLHVEIKAEGSGMLVKNSQKVRLLSFEPEEGSAFDTSDYPALTAVWAETESVWELAKFFHSSPEAIRALNGETLANPVFIPKTK